MNKTTPHTFSATKKPFTVSIDLKDGAVVTGRYLDRGGIDYWASFRRHVPVKKGDTFFWDDRQGFILNGKPHHVSTHPLKKSWVQWAWVPKRMRIAVHPERDETRWDAKARKIRKIKNPKTYWVAMDVRSYWVGCADTPQDAVSNLLFRVKATDLETRRQRRRGVKVVRWHCHKQPDVRKDMREAEEKARKHGLILEGVDWRNSVFSSKPPYRTGSSHTRRVSGGRRGHPELLRKVETRCLNTSRRNAPATGRPHWSPRKNGRP